MKRTLNKLIEEARESVKKMEFWKVKQYLEYKEKFFKTSEKEMQLCEFCNGLKTVAFGYSLMRQDCPECKGNGLV